MKGDFYTGLIRLHLLHHAAREGSIFGLGMIEELGEHGYRLSPGTLYPILHRLEEAGYLKSHRKIVGGKIRRGYAITSQGRRELEKGRQRVRELFGELFENDDQAYKMAEKKGLSSKKSSLASSHRCKK